MIPVELEHNNILERFDEIGQDAIKSKNLMELILNGPTLNGVNKDTLRGIIRTQYAQLRERPLIERSVLDESCCNMDKSQSGWRI